MCTLSGVSYALDIVSFTLSGVLCALWFVYTNPAFKIWEFVILGQQYLIFQMFDLWGNSILDLFFFKSRCFGIFDSPFCILLRKCL